MKKNIPIITTILLLSTILTSKAIACQGPHCEKEFTIFRIVGAQGSTIAKTTFGWDETPWIYVKIKDKHDRVSTSWVNNLKETSVTKWAKVNNKGQAWFTLADWENIKKVGTWTVKGYVGEATRHGIKIDKDACPIQASFTVTPEPMAMVLYGIGGLPIAANLLRRRKQTA